MRTFRWSSPAPAPAASSPRSPRAMPAREVLVLERDAAPAGSTALSSGFIPAGRHPLAARGRRRRFAGTHGRRHPAQEPRRGGSAHRRRRLRGRGPALEWLADAHGIAFVLVEGFLYPGHTAPRMHAVPEKTGAALDDRLLRACAAAGVEMLPSAHVTRSSPRRTVASSVSASRVPTARAKRSAATRWCSPCPASAATRRWCARKCPEIADAPYFGHAGNRGDALRWGEALGAAVRDLSAYQGHGSVATPHGMLHHLGADDGGRHPGERRGERFCQRARRLFGAMPAGIAAAGRLSRGTSSTSDCIGWEWNFPTIARRSRPAPIRSAPDIAALAATCDLPGVALARTLDDVARYAAGSARIRSGADFATQAGAGRAVSGGTRDRRPVSHAGGLEIDAQARVLDAATGRRCPISSPAAAPRAACPAPMPGATCRATACSPRSRWDARPARPRRPLARRSGTRGSAPATAAATGLGIGA